MDLATIFGILGGFALMFSALVIAGGHAGGERLAFGQFIDIPAAIMVLGGGLCVVLTSVPLKVFLSLPGTIKKLVYHKANQHAELVSELVKLSETARTHGLLALERVVADLRNPTLVMALQMAIDGTRSEVIEGLVRKEIEADEAHTHVEKRMFELMGRCGPAFGMIATLLGLILMLGNLDNPESIGPNMAMALVGTLYGAAMANMICMPCAEKISYLGHQAKIAKEIILDGVLAIRDGDSPRVVEQKLSSYLLFDKTAKVAA